MDKYIDQRRSREIDIHCTYNDTRAKIVLELVFYDIVICGIHVYAQAHCLSREAFFKYYSLVSRLRKTMRASHSLNVHSHACAVSTKIIFARSVMLSLYKYVSILLSLALCWPMDVSTRFVTDKSGLSSVHYIEGPYEGHPINSENFIIM